MASEGLPTMVVGAADLEWWLDLAPTLTSREASTMKDIPHSYFVAGKTPGFSAEDCVRASRVIRTFGKPGMFHRHPNIYLHSRDGRVKWWLMSGPNTVYKNDLINQGAAELTYGKQTLPDTTSGAVDALYNAVSVDFDNLMGRNRHEYPDEKGVRRMIIRHFGGEAPRTLDIGCGTGILLDLGVTSPRLYTGVDESRGMLNQLLMKHPEAVDVYAMPFGDAGSFELQRTFDLVIAGFGSASYLSPLELQRAHAMVKPGGLGLFMTYPVGWGPTELPWTWLPQFEAAHRELQRWSDVVRGTLGAYNVTMVRP